MTNDEITVCYTGEEEHLCGGRLCKYKDSAAFIPEADGGRSDFVYRKWSWEKFCAIKAIAETAMIHLVMDKLLVNPDKSV